MRCQAPARKTWAYLHITKLLAQSRKKSTSEPTSSPDLKRDVQSSKGPNCRNKGYVKERSSVVVGRDGPTGMAYKKKPQGSPDIARVMEGGQPEFAADMGIEVERPPVI